MNNPRVTVLILGGGQGKRLFPLTSYRSKPAVPFGAKYRLVDIPISNSLNSGLGRIYVLTQFNSTSLHRHIHRTYPFESFSETGVELLAAEQTLAHKDWFQGTADAVRKSFAHFHEEGSDTILVLSGDHLYRMDYQDILKFHWEKDADVTISTVPVTKRDVPGFGIMQIKSDAKIKSFLEKPSSKENVSDYVIPDNIRRIFSMQNEKEDYLASMGVYVFRYDCLKKLLSGSETDFGKEVIPKAIQSCRVFGYVFNGYWRDIGTIRSFYESNLDLTRPESPLDFMVEDKRILTRSRFLPPSKIVTAKLKNALIGDGSHINCTEISNSVVGLRSVIGHDTTIRNSILLGNDFYDRKGFGVAGTIGIGKNCHIENCIIDKNVRIGNRVKIKNVKNVQEKDALLYCIRDGVVIIPKAATIPDGTVI